MTDPKPDTPAEPTPAEIMETASAFMRSRVLLTAYQLDLFTVLGDETRTSQLVAEALGSASRYTNRLMNALCSMGFLIKEDGRTGRFRNAPAAAKFLVRGRPAYLANLTHTAHLWETWSTLTEVVRRGECVAGGHVEERGEKWQTAFIAAMHHFARQRAPGVVDMIDLSGVSRVLDVGGGSGAYSMAFVGARERITATVFDLPSICPLTRQYIEEAGLSHKITVVEGDLNVDDLPSGYDLVFLSMILHSNSAEQCAALIRNSADALNPGGKVVVSEFLVDEDRTGPLFGTLFALNMAVGTEAGDTYTESEITAWMKKAGLTDFERKDTDSNASLVIGRRPA